MKHSRDNVLIELGQLLSQIRRICAIVIGSSFRRGAFVESARLAGASTVSSAKICREETEQSARTTTLAMSFMLEG